MQATRYQDASDSELQGRVLEFRLLAASLQNMPVCLCVFVCVILFACVTCALPCFLLDIVSPVRGYSYCLPNYEQCFPQITMDRNNLKFKGISLNVRGICTFEKRKSIFNWLSGMPIFVFYKKLTARLH